MKYCQGTKCHEYRTKDRIRGTKGSKYYATRRRSEFYYGQGNFCSFACMNFFNKAGMTWEVSKSKLSCSPYIFTGIK